MKSKLIVFGASGFIGQALLKKMIQKNDFEIIAVSRHANRYVSHKIKNHPKIQWYPLDIFQITQFPFELNSSDIIVNLIGKIKGTKQELFAANFSSVQMLSQIFSKNRENPPQFIFLSALSGGPFASPDYRESKFKAEQLIEKTWANYSIIQSGLVVDYHRPRSLIEALGIKLLSHIFKNSFHGTHPISLTKLIAIIQKEMSKKGARIIQTWN